MDRCASKFEREALAHSASCGARSPAPAPASNPAFGRTDGPADGRADAHAIEALRRRSPRRRGSLQSPKPIRDPTVDCRSCGSYAIDPYIEQSMKPAVFHVDDVQHFHCYPFLLKLQSFLGRGSGSRIKDSTQEEDTEYICWCSLLRMIYLCLCRRAARHRRARKMGEGEGDRGRRRRRRRSS